ncbi:TonB dependent receptor [compost metagenome]
MDIQIQPIQNLFIHGGAAYNESKITRDENSTTGLRPVNSGPTWSATWYVNYETAIANASKWILGIGGNYVGQDLIINSKTAGSFSTNDYTLFNSTIGYQYKQFSCNFTTENLFNQRYYYGGRGFITQGNLRQCILSMRLHF